jgi:hypothetical protein
MKTIPELEAEEQQAWEKVKEAKAPYEAANKAWGAAMNALNLAKMREELKAEMNNEKA